jgi:hypothetical protein
LYWNILTKACNSKGFKNTSNMSCITTKPIYLTIYGNSSRVSVHPNAYVGGPRAQRPSPILFYLSVHSFLHYILSARPLVCPESVTQKSPQCRACAPSRRLRRLGARRPASPPRPSMAARLRPSPSHLLPTAATRLALALDVAASPIASYTTPWHSTPPVACSR